MWVKHAQLAILVAVIVLCHGVPWGENRRKSSVKLGMIRPTYTDISNYSYTVAVLVDIDLLGGGALIQQNWVLTAASVLRGFNASEISVRVASNSAYEGGRIHSVTQTIVHPLYATNSSYNLALLKLDSPIYPKIATKVTYVARIPFTNNGIDGITTGYGATSSTQANDDGLEIAQNSVYTSSYCQQNWGVLVSSQYICAFSEYTVPCYGDDGDPLTRCWNGTQCELLGIATGLDKCDTYEPYTFVDVGQFTQWIRTNINQSLTDDTDILTDV